MCNQMLNIIKSKQNSEDNFFIYRQRINLRTVMEMKCRIWIGNFKGLPQYILKACEIVSQRVDKYEVRVLSVCDTATKQKLT